MSVESITTEQVVEAVATHFKKHGYGVSRIQYDKDPGARLQTGSGDPNTLRLHLYSTGFYGTVQTAASISAREIQHMLQNEGSLKAEDIIIVHGYWKGDFFKDVVLPGVYTKFNVTQWKPICKLTDSSTFETQLLTDLPLKPVKPASKSVSEQDFAQIVEAVISLQKRVIAIERYLSPQSKS